MEEFYEIIENKIKSSGFNGEVDGYTIYNEICDFIDDKDIGEYIFMVKHSDDVIFEYNIQIMENNFNLSLIKISHNNNIFEINFD